MTARLHDRKTARQQKSHLPMAFLSEFPFLDPSFLTGQITKIEYPCPANLAMLVKLYLADEW